MADQNQCGNCTYFIQLNENEIGKAIGNCRCNPPQAYNEGVKSKIARFPIVLDSMWCGAWEEGK